MCQPTKVNTDEAVKEDLNYERLQAPLDKVKEREVTTISMADFNAKVGSNNTGYENIMGKHGHAQMNENGEMFADFCAENNIVTGGPQLPHKQEHKVTWVFPDQVRSEEHTSELQSRQYLVCRLLLEKKKKKTPHPHIY